MYHNLYSLQHFNEVTYYLSIQDYRKYNIFQTKKVNLILAKEFCNISKYTNIHNTDFRSVENNYQNIWIEGLIKKPILILQDYGNDSWWNSKWREIMFGSEFDPSLGITNTRLYLIDQNKVIHLGKHNLTKNQFLYYKKNFDTKRPFNISFFRRKYMIIHLRYHYEEFSIKIDTRY